MVVNTGKQAKSGNKSTTLPQSSNIDVEYTGYRRGPRGKCPMMTSIIFNLLMLALLLGAGYYLCRYRREICRMKIDHGIEVAEMKGIDYEVKDCDIQLIYEDSLLTFDELQSDDGENEITTQEGELEIAVDILKDEDDNNKRRKRKRNKHRIHPHARPSQDRPGADK